MTLVGVEVPPPYAGDSTSSTATINSSGQLATFPSGDVMWQQLIHVGDIIRFGYQGRSYMLLGPSAEPAAGVLPTFFTPNGSPPSSNPPPRRIPTSGAGSSRQPVSPRCRDHLQHRYPATCGPRTDRGLFRPRRRPPATAFHFRSFVSRSSRVCSRCNCPTKRSSICTQPQAA